MEEESFIDAFGDVPTDLAGDYSQLYIFHAEDFGAWYRRVRDAHKRELAEQQDSLTVGMQPMTEENMAEGGWVRGPLDADGKMWRSGDMSDSNWGVIEGIAYEDGRWLVSGHDTSAPWIPADSIRHHHEPTVEEERPDSLDRIADELEKWCDHVDVDGDACGKPRALVERIRRLAAKEDQK